MYLKEHAKKLSVIRNIAKEKFVQFFCVLSIQLNKNYSISFKQTIADSDYNSTQSNNT